MKKFWMLFAIIGLAAGWWDREGEEDYAEPEHYSWDLLPKNPYEDTEIIIDPYAEEEATEEDDEEAL